MKSYVVRKHFSISPTANKRLDDMKTAAKKMGHYNVTESQIIESLILKQRSRKEQLEDERRELIVRVNEISAHINKLEEDEKVMGLAKPVVQRGVS